MHTIIVCMFVIILVIDNHLLMANSFKADKRKADESELETLLEQSQDKCTGRRCVQSDQCCPGSVCVDVDGILGTCLPIYGVSEGQSCQSDDDCETGLSCAYNVNYVINPSALYQVKSQRSCQSVGREMMKKQYNNECQTSSECDVSRGLCCQVIKRHRMAPRKLCYYFSDPQSCIGPVDVTYAKPLHHTPTNVFFKARIG